MQQDLFVVFDASAHADIERLRRIESAVLTAAPNAALCAPHSSPFRARGCNYRINGNNKADAIKIIREQAQRSEIALVTLCPEMMKAAAGHGITIVPADKPDDIPGTLEKLRTDALRKFDKI